jgi:hypothetical protein
MWKEVMVMKRMMGRIPGKETGFLSNVKLEITLEFSQLIL